MKLRLTPNFSRIIWATAMSCFILILMCPPNTTQAQDAAETAATPPLRWNFKTGESFKIELGQLATVTSEVDDRSRKVTNNMQLAMQWTVDSVDESGTATLTQTITQIKLTTVTPTEGGEKVTTVDTSQQDTQKGLAKPLLQQVLPLIDSKFIVQVTSRGEIESVEIPRETMDALRAAPESMQLRKILTEEGLKQIFGQTAMVLPENAISAGETWTTNRVIESPLGTFEQIHHYTYNGTSSGDASIHEFSVESELVEKEASKSGGKVIDFKGSGTMLLNSELGFFNNSKIANTMKTEKPYRDLTINTIITSTISMVVTKL